MRPINARQTRVGGRPDGHVQPAVERTACGVPMSAHTTMRSGLMSATWPGASTRSIRYKSTADATISSTST